MRWPNGAVPSDPVMGDRSHTPRVGVYEGALGAPERLASLAALFPAAEFLTLDDDSRDTAFDVLIIAMMADKAAAAVAWLKSLPPRTRVIVILHEADVVTSRQLLREGAADVVPAPASEPSLALALERLLSAPAQAAPSGGENPQVVALLKAAGGVGATSLGVQAATILAGRGAGQVLFADLDLQHGAAAAYLDLPEALSVVDTLSAGDSLSETQFASVLARHQSGLKLLAAPKEMVSLEALRTSQVAPIVAGLRQNGKLTVIDLPAAWLSWTNEVLAQADRIVIVTQLTVPHVQMMKRQIAMLAQWNISKPLILVCNGVSRELQASLSVKAAERALGRAFDVVVPYDSRTMSAAVNQGVELSTVRRGTPLEKAVTALADKISEGAFAAAKPARR